MEDSQASLSNVQRTPWLVIPATNGSPAWAVCPSLHASNTCKFTFRGQVSTAQLLAKVYFLGLPELARASVLVCVGARPCLPASALNSQCDVCQAGAGWRLLALPARQGEPEAAAAAACLSWRSSLWPHSSPVL